MYLQSESSKGLSEFGWFFWADMNKHMHSDFFLDLGLQDFRGL